MSIRQETPVLRVTANGRGGIPVSALTGWKTLFCIHCHRIISSFLKLLKNVEKYMSSLCGVKYIIPQKNCGGVGEK